MSKRKVVHECDKCGHKAEIVEGSKYFEKVLAVVGEKLLCPSCTWISETPVYLVEAVGSEKEVENEC